jgi:hypothetical protein
MLNDCAFPGKMFTDMPQYRLLKSGLAFFNAVKGKTFGPENWHRRRRAAHAFCPIPSDTEPNLGVNSGAGPPPSTGLSRQWQVARIPRGYAGRPIARKVRLIRGPTGRAVFGSWCSQWCWVDPAMTRHEPCGSSSARRWSEPRCFI